MSDLIADRANPATADISEARRLPPAAAAGVIASGSVLLWMLLVWLVVAL